MTGNGHGNPGPSHATAAQFAEYDAKVAEIVREHSWMAQAVFPTRDDPTGKFFVYTVGLHAKGHPELIIAGLDQGTSHGILSTVVQRVLAGESFEERTYDDVLVGGFQVRLEKLDRTTVDEHLQTAQRYANADVDAFQILWPDGDGKLPPDCPSKYSDLQRLDR